jgi:hypothetical protein
VGAAQQQQLQLRGVKHREWQQQWQLSVQYSKAARQILWMWMPAAYNSSSSKHYLLTSTQQQQQQQAQAAASSILPAVGAQGGTR